MNHLKSRLQTVVLATFVLLALPSVCSCSSKKYRLQENILQINTADGRSIPVQAELAIKTQERNYGFMNRKVIPDGTGMLFVFESDQVLSFWMKNTPHPLSIAYIDADGKIIDIYDMTPYSLSSVQSSRSVRYALEVPQGWFEKEKVNIGDVVFASGGKSLRTIK